jgi:RNA polymerase sigma-70 factor (ECF subfamily)
VSVVAESDFDELFRTHYPRLVAIGVAMSGDEEVARELAQETMLRAHDRWSELVDFDQPGAWLRRVMTNLLIDHHRRRTAEHSALGRVTGRGSTVGADVADRSADAATWAALVEPLPLRQRAIIVLHYGDDRSVAEVAELLGISPGTVKSALSKARRRLHEIASERTGDG